MARTGEQQRRALPPAGAENEGHPPGRWARRPGPARRARWARQPVQRPARGPWVRRPARRARQARRHARRQGRRRPARRARRRPQRRRRRPSLLSRRPELAQRRGMQERPLARRRAASSIGRGGGSLEPWPCRAGSRVGDAKRRGVGGRGDAKGGSAVGSGGRGCARGGGGQGRPGGGISGGGVLGRRWREEWVGEGLDDGEGRGGKPGRRRPSSGG
ncbi:hypothetical protein PVAP13_2NG490106 [Panicum virgatum]|uniref:Uncharacterized protein n=1 Tax=Panicum virgatum TaxID=38727 RepID=A0A8T0W0I9_PANVG|nr:hypothetical protein PVAP13_2NG490106 [Panicum virgatum]